MRFAAPEYLWGLLGLPVLIGLFVLSFRRRRRALEAFGDLRLLKRLSASASLERRMIKASFVVVATLFLILALARPQWGAKLETVTRRGGGGRGGGGRDYHLYGGRRQPRRRADSTAQCPGRHHRV